MKLDQNRIELIVNSLVKTKGLNVLDLGCGDGKFLLELNRISSLQFSSLKGVDSEIVEGHRTWGVQHIYEYVKMDLVEFIDDCKDYFDIIILSNVLHYITYDKTLNILSKLAPLINPNGIIYIEIANEFHTYAEMIDRYVLTQSRFNELNEYCSTIGLRIIKGMRGQKHTNDYFLISYDFS